MRRWIFTAMAALLLLSQGALAAPTYEGTDQNPGQKPPALLWHRITLDTSTTQSRNFALGQSCSVKFTKVGAGNVVLYEVPTSSAAYTSGVAETTFTASTTEAYTFKPGSSYGTVRAASDSDGSIVEISCLNDGTFSGGGGGVVGSGTLAEMNAYQNPQAGDLWQQTDDDGTGDCATTGGTDSALLCQYDAATTAWVPAGIAGGTDNLGNHTATTDLDLDGNDINDAGAIEGQVIGEVYYCDQYAGADLWEQCQAAFDAAVAANARAIVLEMPRGSYAVTSGTLDLCDDRSGTLNYGVTLRGQGSATTQGGTRIGFNDGFQTTAVSGTFTFGNDGTRDTITRSSGSWLTDGFKRGDLIETTGFSTATNNYPRTGGTETEGEHLKVYRATATVLTVESETAVGTTLPSSGSESGNVRRLNAGIETCGSGAYVENVTFVTTANYADILIHHRPDNAPALACSAANVPYTTYCTGAGTGTGMSSTGGVNGGVSKVYGFGGRFGVAITSVENGGQADHYRIEDSHFHTNRVGVYYDSLQAQPGVKIENTQLEAFTKNGARLASGSMILDDTTIISAASDCIADTFGPCNHVYMGYANVDSLVLKGRSFIEVKGGNGITVADGGNDPVHRRTLNLGTSRILANTSSETDIALVDAPNACLTVEMPGTRFTSGVDPTNAPTVTFGNSNQGSTCDSEINGHWSVADTGSGGGTYTPVVTINDSIPVSLFGIAGTSGNCVEWDADGKLVDSGEPCDGDGTLEIPNSDTLPGTCAVGQVYMDTDATSGQRIYACESANTWVLQGDGGGGGSVASDSIWDALGDIVVATGADTAIRVPLGSTGQVLTVSGGFAGWIGNPGGASSGQIAALTQKATPVAADHLLIEDSAAANAKRRVTVGSLGSVLQPLDADLTDIAALATTAHGRGLLDDADPAASRASIGLATTDDVVFNSVSTADPGDGDRGVTLLDNGTTLVNADTLAVGECRLGFVGGDVYKHCQSGSLTAVESAATIPKHTECFPFYAPTDTIADSDDVQSLWRAPAAITITEVWCETDTGTVNMDLQIDDGTPADVMGTDLVCASTAVSDSSGLTGSMADGDRLDLAITSVASSPTRLTVCAEYTYD